MFATLFRTQDRFFAKPALKPIVVIVFDGPLPSNVNRLTPDPTPAPTVTTSPAAAVAAAAASAQRTAVVADHANEAQSAAAAATEGVASLRPNPSPETTMEAPVLAAALGGSAALTAGAGGGGRGGGCWKRGSIRSGLPHVMASTCLQ